MFKFICVICGALGVATKKDIEKVVYTDTFEAETNGIHNRIEDLKSHIDTRFDDLLDRLK